MFLILVRRALNVLARFSPSLAFRLANKFEDIVAVSE